MKFTMENSIAILVLILSEAWFLHGYFSGNPEFEPGILFIVTLGALFTKEKIKEHFGFTDNIGRHDLDLFDEFQRVFPAEPTLRVLKETDFGGSFRKGDIQPLYDFVETWSSVEKEFLSNKLEKDKKALYEAAGNLAGKFASKTVPVGNGDFISVFPDNLRGNPRPSHVIEDARVLNEQASLFVPKYEGFIRKCRDVLKS